MTSCSWPIVLIVSKIFIGFEIGMGMGMGMGTGPSPFPFPFPSVFGVQVPCDHYSLNFTGAFINLGNLGVPEQSLHRIVLHIAVAAEDLDRLGGHPHGGLACHELRHRAELGDGFAP